MPDRCNVPVERLTDLVVGRLSTTEKAVLEAHLSKGCPRCQKELEWLRKAARVTSAGVSAHSQDWAIQHVTAMLSQPREVLVKTAPLLTRLLVTRVPAALTFDSLLAKPTVGIRAGGLAPRQMVYSAGDVDIDMHVEPHRRDSMSDLIGQVLVADGSLGEAAGTEVIISGGAERTRSLSTDACGEFVADSLRPGRYEMLVRLRDREIEVSGIEL